MDFCNSLLFYCYMCLSITIPFLFLELLHYNIYLGPYTFCNSFFISLLHMSIYNNFFYLNYTTKEITSIFPFWTFHLYVAIFQQHLYMAELVLPILLTRKQLNQWVLVVMLKSSHRKCQLAAPYLMWSRKSLNVTPGF
jgi:hypothetical protein